jgi:hypothetical protein
MFVLDCGLVSPHSTMIKYKYGASLAKIMSTIMILTINTNMDPY